MRWVFGSLDAIFVKEIACLGLIESILLFYLVEMLDFQHLSWFQNLFDLWDFLFFFFGRFWAWSVNQICKLLFQMHSCVNSMLISWIVHPLSWCFVYLFLFLLLLRSLCWLDLVMFCRLLKVKNDWLMNL